MKKINNQSGFGAIEVLLTLIFAVLLVFVGWYIYHTDHKTTTSTSTSTSTNTSPTLTQAVSRAQTVYDAYSKQVGGGQVLQDKSQWATNNVSAAEDLQFINANKSWFTSAFITNANNNETNNTTPTGGEFMICTSGIAYYNSDLKISGNSLTGQTASVTATYTTGNARSGGIVTHTLPITLRSVSNSWMIDSIDLSGC